MRPRKSGFANIPIHLSGIYLTGAGLCGSGVFSNFFQPSTFSSLSELFSHFQRTLSHVFFFVPNLRFMYCINIGKTSLK